MLSNGWYLENMPRYKAAFEDNLISIPENADILEDHRRFEVINGIPKLGPGRTKGQDKGKRHGDSGIAGCMAVFAAKQEDCALSFGSVPRPSFFEFRM